MAAAGQPSVQVPSTILSTGRGSFGKLRQVPASAAARHEDDTPGIDFASGVGTSLPRFPLKPTPVNFLLERLHLAEGGSESYALSQWVNQHWANDPYYASALSAPPFDISEESENYTTSSDNTANSIGLKV
jgi:hypothetical protein